MGKLFEGNVSVIANTKGEIALKRDQDGAWNSTNVKQLFEKCVELSKKEGKPLNTWSFFQPSPGDSKLNALKESGWLLNPTTTVANGKDVVLGRDHYGKPKISILPPKVGVQGSRLKSTKLA
jgi:hypothetical protein|tara:strand:- start:313 stop:678 length:366 start_codon:yes stop_codon:yes gene_type:complete